MPNAQPKQIYKYKPYIMGPRTGRVHLEDGAAPWWSGLADDQSEPDPSQRLVPGMVGVTQDQMQQTAPPPVAAPESEDSLLNPGYGQSLDRMKALYGERPERTPAHWWQKAISGAIGGLAGISNAAGHLKHPLDVSQAVENIQHPGYAGKLQDWQSRVAALQGQTDLEAQRQNAELKAQQIGAQAESRLSNAQARQQMSDPHRNQQQLDPDFARENFPWMHPDASGQYWVDKTVANTIQKPVKPPPPDRGVEVSDPEAARFLGVDPANPIDRDLYKVWLTHKAAMELVDRKPTNVKQDKVWLAQEAANGNAQAQKALDILAKNTLASKPPKAAAGHGSPTIINLTSDAIDQQARNVLSGGALPAVGMGKDAAAIRMKILNRAAELNPDTDLSLAKAQNRAISAAMSTQEKMAGQIGSFEKTANRNMDVALGLSNKVNRTGIPVINRWIQAGRQNVTGDPDAAAFHAAINTVANEYAKVVSSATGGGVTSDSARHEAMGLMNTAQTPEQLQAVINTMRTDMENRISSFADERDDQEQRMGEIGAKPPRKAAKATAPQPRTSQNPNPNGYVVNHVYGGLTYLGGDPKNQSSWRK